MLGVYSVGGLQALTAQYAFQLTIVAFQRFWTKNVKKAFDFPKNNLKKWCFSLDVCKKWVKNARATDLGSGYALTFRLEEI